MIKMTDHKYMKYKKMYLYLKGGSYLSVLLNKITVSNESLKKFVTSLETYNNSNTK